MKRTIGLTITGVLVAASVSLAAPAQAADQAPPCVLDQPQAPTLTTAYIDEAGRLRINPGGVEGDVAAYGDWAPAWAVYWAFCIEERLPTDSAWCLAGVALDIARSMDPASFYFRYVYEYGGEWIVDIPLLTADAVRTFNCSGVSIQ